MLWKELMRRLNTAFERHPEQLNDIAMCRDGENLYQLDLFRSLSIGRLHIGPAYPYPDTDEPTFEDHDELRDARKEPDVEAEDLSMALTHRKIGDENESS